MAQQFIFTFANLVPEIILKVENRVSDQARAAIWLRDSLLEISSNPSYRDDFDQLQIFGLKFALTAGTQEYPEAPFIPAPTLPNSSGVNLATLDFLIWLDPTALPPNQIRKKLEYASFQETDRFQPLNSLPTQWYRFNANIGFNPVPDLNYQVQPRILQLHPINDDNLPATQILLPREWNHILVLAAAEHGYLEYGEYEKSAAIHKLIHGDPDDQKNPGLIYSIKRRPQRERWRGTQQLRPVYKPIGWGR